MDAIRNPVVQTPIFCPWTQNVSDPPTVMGYPIETWRNLDFCQPLRALTETCPGPSGKTPEREKHGPGPAEHARSVDFVNRHGHERYIATRGSQTDLTRTARDRSEMCIRVQTNVSARGLLLEREKHHRSVALFAPSPWQPLIRQTAPVRALCAPSTWVAPWFPMNERYFGCFGARISFSPSCTLGLFRTRHPCVWYFPSCKVASVGGEGGFPLVQRVVRDLHTLPIKRATRSRCSSEPTTPPLARECQSSPTPNPSSTVFPAVSSSTTATAPLVTLMTLVLTDQSSP